MDNKPVSAGEVLKQDEAHVRSFANRIQHYQQMAADLDWSADNRSIGAFYDTACDLVDNTENLDLTEYEANVLITVFVAEAVRATALIR